MKIKIIKKKPFRDNGYEYESIGFFLNGLLIGEYPCRKAAMKVRQYERHGHISKDIKRQIEIAVFKTGNK